MADVQLEHGFLRVANALDEAVTYAPFKTMAQHKIVRCIIRMTYGWRQRTVKVSVGALAQRCNLPYSGGFRRSLDELIREGVVIQVRRGIGAEAGVYAVNKDHENWGHYSVASQMIERLFRTRLPADDDALAGVATQPSLLAPIEANTTDGSSRPPEGEQTPPVSDSGQLPSRGRTNPPPSDIYRPLEGERNRPNSSHDKGLEGRKDISSTLLERQTTTAADDVDKGVDQSRFALRLVSLMNAGIEKRWGEQINPLTFGQCQQLAADLITEGFTDLEVARVAIDMACTASRQPGPPAHPNYFRNVVREAHQRAQQKAFDESGKRRATSTTTPIAQVIDPASHAMAVELETNWKRERRLAGVEWGKDPENADAYREIVSECNAKFDGALESSWGKIGRDRMVIERCEEASGFPSFDVWRTDRPRIPATMPFHVEP